MPVEITEEMRKLLLKQNVAVVGTVDPRGVPNLSLKGVVRVDPDGYIYFFDLYRGKTRSNLKNNRNISLSVFSVGQFNGFQFKGEGECIDSGPLFDEMLEVWNSKRRKLISQRIVSNIRRGFTHRRSEIRFPDPKYLVRVEVKEALSLLPRDLQSFPARGAEG